MLDDYVRLAIRRSGIRPSKAKGQNFLIDDNVLAEIIRAASLDGHEHVAEVGPGLGTLTQSIARRCHRLTAFEIDERLVIYLRQWVAPEYPGLIIEDVPFNSFRLQLALEAAEAENRPLKLVTNLPYQISAAFLHSVIDYSERIDKTVVMLQREVVQRVTAQPGDKGFSSFSLYLQTFLQARHICDVPPEAFLPQPRVNSSVIALTALPAELQPRPDNRRLYFELIEGVFRNRRKQIANGLRLAFPDLPADACLSVLKRAGIDPSLRPQELGMDDYVRISDAVNFVQSGGEA